VPYSTDPSSVGNKFIHLTNSSIQKHNMGSVPNANNDSRSAAQSVHPADRALASEKGGTKLKLSYLWRRFQEDGIDADKVRSDIEAVLVKTLMVANDAIPNQINSFELYGFDIMLDAKLKPWLIEVNASPSLGCDFQVDIDVKHKLMQDTMRLVDPLEFDRGVLLEELEARLEELRKEKKRPFANPSAMYGASHGKRTQAQQRLDRTLNLVLGGKTPRTPAATPPAHLGNYKQIAPGGKVFEMTQKLMQKCLHSHRKKGGTR
jgi:tubulin polyglutamylase TTLL5